MKIAFLGFGTISRILFEELSSDTESEVSFWGFLDPHVEEGSVNTHMMRKANDVGELIRSPAALIVEAAGQNVVEEYVPDLLKAGKDVLSMTVGAYLNEELLSKIEDLCRLEGSGSLYLPSGALPAVDMLRAVSLRRIDSVELITRKPYEALQGAPGLEEVKENSLENREAITIFHGDAKEAVRLFPKNANISATLSLAGIGADRTKVTIMADPSIERNIHKIVVKGEFGEFSAEVASNPSSNPKTSLTAPMSAVSLIKKLTECVKVGS